MKRTYTEILFETSRDFVSYIYNLSSLTNRENETEEGKGRGEKKSTSRFIKIIVSLLLKGVKGEAYGVIKKKEGGEGNYDVSKR